MIFWPIDALNELCAQLTRDLFLSSVEFFLAQAKFRLLVSPLTMLEPLLDQLISELLVLVWASL